MTILDLLNKANTGYPDGFLSVFYDPETGEFREGQGDALARFIVSELIETFEDEDDAPEEDHAYTATSALMGARDDLDSVIIAINKSTKKE